MSPERRFVLKLFNRLSPSLEGVLHSVEAGFSIANFPNFMSTTTNKPTTVEKKDTRVVDGLNLVLADSYALMALTHLAHWNVEGADFFPLHKAFQEQYENLFEGVDEVAERVRALDAYAIGGLGTLGKVAQMDEFRSPMPQKDYVAALIVAHEKVLDDAT